MGSSSGPRGVAKDTVVFHYDTGETFFSFKGEPTDNLIPSPGINSFPTFGNGWATYNTNQYCGNNGCAVHWDIPAIASVSSNIITTVSAHQIRSFDVITPLTSGGGVSGGANYLAKKISDTQFSLHDYNSSQDGSQGFINTATGGFKVHDSYWLDQRVSVNASSFPTKWWGSPHLPNSGIVKEIIPGGFPVRGNTKTDCIRLHWFRPDGVTDGMSYGPDAYVTIGQPVTTSFFLRAASSNAVGQYCAFQHYNYGGPAGANGYFLNAFTGALGEWVKCSFTFTPTHEYLISYWFPSTGNMKIDLANIQVEQKNHATQFVAGSRTATQGLLDLKGNSTINLSNVSFDANAKIVFDGTDDFITLPSNLIPINQITIEFVCTNSNSGANTSIIAGGTSGNQDLNIHLPWGDSNVYWDCGRPFNRIYKATTLAERTGVHHWVFTKNPSSGIMNIYLDGTLWHSGGGLTSTMPVLNSVSLGRYDIENVRAYYFPGTIPVTKIYSKELSAAEVQAQYNTYKTRFNLP